MRSFHTFIFSFTATSEGKFTLFTQESINIKQQEQ